MAKKNAAAKKKTSARRGMKDLTAKDAKAVKGGLARRPYKVE